MVDPVFCVGSGIILKVLIKSLILLRTTFIKSYFGPMRSQLLRWSLLIGQKLDNIKGVRSKIRLYMRTFSIIPDPKHKIYQEIFVMDEVPIFHPPYLEPK